MATPVHAQGQSLRISPAILTITLSPGKTSSHEAIIENLTDEPLPLTANLNDFATTGEEGGYIFEQSRQNPLLQWITLSEKNFILGPKEKKKIFLTIKTPSTIQLGGYYGLLFFEPVLQNTTTPQTQISAKVGMLMLANIGVQDTKAKRANILTFSPSFISQDGTVPFLLRVQNVALNFFTAKPILTITPLLSFPNQQKPMYLEEKIIFPGKIRRWTENNVIHDLSPNIYKAHLVVATGVDQTEVQDTYFVVFPYVNALLIIFIGLLILFLLAKRKRLGAAIKVFFSR